jgi:cyanophycin synthetase
MTNHSLVLSFRLLRLGWRFRMGWKRLRRTSTTIEMAAFTGFYERLWRDAARAVSAEMTEISAGLWRIRRGGRSTLIQNYIVQIDDPVVLNVAGDKALCHRLLVAERLPVAPHEVFTLATLDKAEAFMRRHAGESFVVKPAVGTSGARGVTTHIATPRGCRSAAVLASLYSHQILIERWIPGESYRLLFLDGEMIHASRRNGWRLIGDGRSTIAELMTRASGSGSPARGGSAVADDSNRTLAAQGLGLDSVPPSGRAVLVRSAGELAAGQSEIRTVFDHDATAEVGSELREQAFRAVRALGSRFAGLDIITIDPGRRLEDVGGVITEINTTPGLHHHYGLAGDPPAVGPAVAVLARLLEIDDSSISASAKNFTAQLSTSKRP